MEKKDPKFIGVHRSPLWRDKANFIFQAIIPPDEGVDGNDSEWEQEQLWGQIISEGRIRVCCIPFFVYNIALGDEVLLDSEYFFKEVVKASGNVVFRIWFELIDNSVRIKIIEELSLIGAVFEMSSERLIALSIDRTDMMSIVDYLKLQQNKGYLIYEHGFN